MGESTRDFDRMLAKLAGPETTAEAVAPGLPVGMLLAGRYRVLRLIGRGGMGEVYEAEDHTLRRKVALKCMRQALRDAPRLLAEGRAAAGIQHPNVVQVHDVAQHEDTVFLVMEYLEGQTLGSWLSERPHSVPELLRVVLPAMRGVAEAHARGVIHRDIKPDNILLCRTQDSPEPVPKVLDFGISKLHAQPAQEELTASGITLGTPSYMALEQLHGSRDLDARVDVYAFGVLLYEALTGRRPFEAGSLAALAIQLATTTPAAPSAARAGLPSALDAIVLKALARERENRFASLTAFAQELEPFRAGLDADGESAVADARRRPRQRAIWVGLALLSALALCAWLSARGRQARLAGERAPMVDGALSAPSAARAPDVAPTANPPAQPHASDERAAPSMLEPSAPPVQPRNPPRVLEPLGSGNGSVPAAPPSKPPPALVPASTASPPPAASDVTPAAQPTPAAAPPQALPPAATPGIQFRAGQPSLDDF